MPSIFTLPPPPDLGLPEIFPSWRQPQLGALEACIATDKRVIGLVLPTGAGKSLVGPALQQLTGERVLVLTSTRALQAQMQRDFPDAAIVMGQRAYPCRAVQPGELFADWNPNQEPWTVDRGPCHAGFACPYKQGGCGYFDAQEDAKRARLVVANYAVWMASKLYAGGLGHADWLVCDEAHDAPDQLASALRVEIKAKDVQDVLPDVGWPWGDVGAIETWQKVARSWLGPLQRKMEDWSPSSKREGHQYATAKRLVRGLQRLIQFDPELTIGRWTDGRSPVSWSADPLWAGAFAEEALFQGASKIVLMSATVRPKTADLLGFGAAAMHWYEDAAGFDPRRRPVYLWPQARVRFNWSDQEQRKWVTAIEQIIRSRPHWRGIVHTTSYARRNLLLRLCGRDTAARLITHDGGGVESAVQEYINSDNGVLVSPSVTTGYDFPADLCRFQIFGKVPFPDTSDPIVTARQQVDPEYGAYLAMQNWVQAAGRGMRSEDDYCEGFMIDSQALWFIGKHKDLAPSWFLRAVKKIDILPDPLEVG